MKSKTSAIFSIVNLKLILASLRYQLDNVAYYVTGHGSDVKYFAERFMNKLSYKLLQISRYEVWSKITVIFKFRELRMFNFRIFFSCYVGTHVCYICMYVCMLIIAAILNCQFVFDRWWRWRLVGFLVRSLIFYYSQQWIKQTVLSFVYARQQPMKTLKQ